MACVLVIDDEPLIRYVLHETLKDAGYDVFSFASGEEGLSWLEEGRHADAVMVDLKMRTMSGTDFLMELRRRPPWRELSAVLMTGAASVDIPVPHPGAYQALLLKPFDLTCALRTLAGVLADSGARTTDIPEGTEEHA